jgi:hypothetical protein
LGLLGVVKCKTFKRIKEIVARRMGRFPMKLLRVSIKISLDDLYSFSNFFIGWIFGKSNC